MGGLGGDPPRAPSGAGPAAEQTQEPACVGGGLPTDAKTRWAFTGHKLALPLEASLSPDCASVPAQARSGSDG